STFSRMYAIIPSSSIYGKGIQDNGPILVFPFSLHQDFFYRHHSFRKVRQIRFSSSALPYKKDRAGNHSWPCPVLSIVFNLM
ncbi:hypothetical protein, partial [Proteiniphilum sp. X52]|uniref:hypothetical protein n=1 Tax=Proteiniphilum sp. X52 TaxID=2382159 RepID=UPI001C87DA4E